MPSALTHTSSPSSKSLKWTTQRIKSGRVHKRTTSNTSSTSTSSRSPSTCHLKKPVSRQDAIRQLESELAFTYDTFATVNVMFESLQHAYCSSKYEMDQARNETRLSDKEKELLAAYDDLGLQVTHLERQIVKLEKRLAELRSSTPVTQTPSPAVSPAVTSTSPAQDISSPVLSPSTSPYLSYPDYPFAGNGCFYEQQSLYCGFLQSQQYLPHHYQQQQHLQQPYLISNSFFDPTLVYNPHTAGYYFSNTNVIPF
ncbi:hypothetical protein BX666DRAFT_1920747 [Dichotomocladium elegans]|nr:hypothetical protein BX666DRAFT_1920747 [Dichotomocladium elegans]